jgi:hypothetical protein
MPGSHGLSRPSRNNLELEVLIWTSPGSHMRKLDFVACGSRIHGLDYVNLSPLALCMFLHFPLVNEKTI